MNTEDYFKTLPIREYNTRRDILLLFILLLLLTTWLLLSVACFDARLAALETTKTIQQLPTLPQKWKCSISLLCPSFHLIPWWLWSSFLNQRQLLRSYPWVHGLSFGGISFSLFLWTTRNVATLVADISAWLGNLLRYEGRSIKNTFTLRSRRTLPCMCRILLGVQSRLRKAGRTWWGSRRTLREGNWKFGNWLEVGA